MIGGIFDWDGVVIDSAHLHEKSWEILAEEINRSLPADHFERGFGKRNETIIGTMLGWSKDRAEIIQWGKRKEEIYRELGMEQGIPLIEGTRNFITELHSRSIPLVIGTSTERKNIELAIQQHKLEGLFVGSVCSEDVSRGKPDPEVFLKAARLINQDPKVCLVFEDSTHGIEAALRGGMIAVGVSTTNPKSQLLKKGAHIVVDRLDEIDLSILDDLIKSRMR